MSVEFADAMANDNADRVEAEVAEKANVKPITIEQEFAEPDAQKPTQAASPQDNYDDEGAPF